MAFTIPRLTTSALLLAVLPTLAPAATPREKYAAPQGQCDGYPKLAIGMPKGFCAGLVIGPTVANSARPLRLPRSLVQLDDRTWLLSDLGGWGTKTGAIWKIETVLGQPPVLTKLLGGLNLPHALALGPDGLAYVGEMSRIFRFDPLSATPAATITPIITGLPDNRLHDNRHPLSKFVFASDGALLVNVGAPSDQCVDVAGKPSGKTCAESEGSEHAAGLRRYARVAPGRWSSEYTVFARGLRNSVALAVHPTGTILQGENSYDFAGRFTPFDEINRIEAGHHYGWPYCYDLATPTPGWAATNAMNCRSPAHTAPVALLPPHSAPLDMLWYQGAMFPSLRGKLLVTWHGHRATGGRIAAYATDAAGLPMTAKGATYAVFGAAPKLYGLDPAATALILTPGWDKVPRVRPQGSPVGLAVAKDGAIWTTDDRAGVVIRIAADK